MSLVLIANVDFFKKPSGILKICELVLIMITMSLCANYYETRAINFNYSDRSECFLLIASCTFFLGTFLLIISSIISANTESLLRQTLFELLYHIFGFVLIFSGSVAVLSDKTAKFHETRDYVLAAGGIGIIASILYGVSAYDSYIGYVKD